MTVQADSAGCGAGGNSSALRVGMGRVSAPCEIVAPFSVEVVTGKIIDLGLLAFGSFFNRELHLLILLQAAVAIHLDSGEMDEYIAAVLSADKTVTLTGIEPLNSSTNTF